MTCEEARIGLYALLDGELEVGQNVEVLGHLESCTLCQQECEADSRLKTLVREQLAVVPLPEGLWQRVVARIGQAETEGPASIVVRLRGRLSRFLPQIWPLRPARVGLVMACLIALSIILAQAPGTPSFIVDEIVADHLHSMARAAGPADVSSSDPTMILDQLRPPLAGPARVPVVAREDMRLLGGSVCSLRSTKGIRLTYRVGDRTLSFYQLARPAGVTFPRPGAGPLSVEYVDPQHGPGAMVWGDDRFLYALVAEMPVVNLQQLAARM